MTEPSVGRIVHYVSYGTPGGEYTSECRAAVVTRVTNEPVIVDLCAINPTGLFFNAGVRYDETAEAGGTWHWPERVEEN
ncbi:MAG: hypothetical protein ACRD0V_02220 [Acidimicrobiales bacterium]